jgi:predicted component of type VI protein secretion system
MTHEGGTVAMKVQLIVVQGKPEGKVIPLVGPVFKIGRGETCHLRPNSERVSREHAEFTVTADKVVVRDLGSRNGTLVNGKALNQPCPLKDRDLVQVGPLTFAVSLLDEASDVEMPTVPASSSAANAAQAVLDLGAAAEEVAPIAARGSETIMIPAFLDAAAARAANPIPPADLVDDAEYERHPVADADGETVLDIPVVERGAHDEAGDPAKKSRAGDKRGSNAASEILRKMMERGRVAH